jgi:hypothetical protein
MSIFDIFSKGDDFPKTYEWNDGSVRLDPPPPGGSGLVHPSALCTPSREGILTQGSVPQVQYEWQPVQQYKPVSQTTGDWVAIQQQRDWEQWQAEQRWLAQQRAAYEEEQYRQRWEAYEEQQRIAQEQIATQQAREYALRWYEQELAEQQERQQLEIEQETLRQQQAMLQRQFEDEQEWRSQLEQMLWEQQQQAQVVEEEQYAEQPVYFEEPVQYEEQPQYFEQPQPEYVPLPYIPMHERQPRRKLKRLSRNFMPTIPVENWPMGEENNERSDTRVSTVASRSKP